MPRLSSGGSARRIRTPGSRRSGAATSRWIATSAGSGPSSATTRSSTGWGSTRRSPIAAIEAAYAPGRERRVRPPDGHRRRRRRPARRRADHPCELPRRPGAAARRTPSPTRRSTPSIAPRPTARPPPPTPGGHTMTEYEAGLPVEVAFPPEVGRASRALVAEAGWRQLHLAETEKYAHVTYFFNGGREDAVRGRGADPRPEPEGRDVRPAAGDERGGRDRRARRGDRGRTGSTCSSRTSRTRTWSGTPAYWDATFARSRSSTAASAGSSGRQQRAARRRSGRDPRGHRGSRQRRRACGTRDGSPITAHSLNPVPFLLAGARSGAAASPTASSRTSRRRCSSCRPARAGRR